MLIWQRAVGFALPYSSFQTKAPLEGGLGKPSVTSLEEQMFPFHKGTVSIQYNGTNYPASYHLDNGLLTVYYADEHKDFVIHPSWNPEPIARLLLVGIIKELPQE